MSKTNSIVNETCLNLAEQALTFGCTRDQFVEIFHAVAGHEAPCKVKGSTQEVIQATVPCFKVLYKYLSLLASDGTPAQRSTLLKQLY